MSEEVTKSPETYRGNDVQAKLKNEVMLHIHASSYPELTEHLAPPNRIKVRMAGEEIELTWHEILELGTKVLDYEILEITFESLGRNSLWQIFKESDISYIYKVFHKVSEAIKKFHENNIFHGDLHFSNIYIIDDQIIFGDWEYASMIKDGKHSYFSAQEYEQNQFTREVCPWYMLVKVFINEPEKLGVPVHGKSQLLDLLTDGKAPMEPQSLNGYYIMKNAYEQVRRKLRPDLPGFSRFLQFNKPQDFILDPVAWDILYIIHSFRFSIQNQIEPINWNRLQSAINSYIKNRELNKILRQLDQTINELYKLAESSEENKDYHTQLISILEP